MTILLTTVALRRLADPDEAQVSHELFDVPWKDWTRGPGDSATLEVIFSEEEHAARKLEGSPAAPMLLILQPNIDDFLICWFQGGIESVPYNGKPCEAFSIYNSGGETYRVPDACLVPPETALRIAMTFISSQTQADAVQWVRRDDLPVDDAFWEPM